MIKLSKAAAAGSDLGKDFALAMVSVDDTTKEVTELLKRSFPAASALPIVMDPGKKIALTYGTEKFPESYLVDREGKIRYWFVNKRDWGTDEALQCIKSLM